MMTKVTVALAMLVFVTGCSKTDEERRAEVARATPAALVVSPAAAPAAPPAQEARDVPPDNTGRNVRDRDGSSLTPEDQAENDADRTLTQRVRQAIVSNQALSTNAKNVKVITSAGVVTLRGPVNSAEEKAMVAAAARQTPGVARVDDQLEVVTR
jgi:hypothetical protein